MSALPPPAPHTADDAAEFLAGQARKYEDVAIAEHRDGASAKRVGFTRRMAAYYRLGAEALTPPAAEPNMEDMLS